jgi:hypothetical protein
VARTLTDLTELAVGLACLIGAVAAWRHGPRWLGALLAVAGAAAIAHAVVSLV